MRKIKQKILEKYNYKCVGCGKTKELVLFHMDNNPDNNNKIQSNNFK